MDAMNFANMSIEKMAEMQEALATLIEKKREVEEMTAKINKIISDASSPFAPEPAAPEPAAPEPAATEPAATEPAELIDDPVKLVAYQSYNSAVSLSDCESVSSVPPKKRIRVDSPACSSTSTRSGNPASDAESEFEEEEIHDEELPGQKRGRRDVIRHVKCTSRGVVGSKRQLEAPNLVYGSDPVLVPMDARRQGLIDSIVKKHGADFGGDSASLEDIKKQFMVGLIKAGYSEGSYNTKRSHYNCDGVVYNYPKYLAKFMEGGVFKTRADFFAPGAKHAAEQFAWQYAKKTATAVKSFASQTETVQKRRIRKYFTNVMHGFDDYVKICKPTATAPSQ